MSQNNNNQNQGKSPQASGNRHSSGNPNSGDHRDPDHEKRVTPDATDNRDKGTDEQEEAPGAPDDLDGGHMPDNREVPS